MKKLTTALLTALLLLNLAACGEKEPDDTPSGYDDSLISELYSEEGEYTDAENNTLAYSYHVPRIMSETAVAAALNDEIADQFGALVQEQKNMMASRVSLTCLSVTWTSYWNDSLLCLVVRAEMDGDTSTTETYSYDFFGGKRLMSEDLLARCELSTQDFITAARRTAANYFDETYRDALSGSMGGADFIASYAERRAWTLSDENINAETRTTTGANGEEQTTVYTAQEYTLIIPWRDGIEDSIKANVAAWTEMARKQELEELLPEKLTELDNACRKAIVEGCWVELADGSTQHFALTEADQINLNVALEAVKAGAEGYPYHADGELCRVFSAADINAVAAAAVAHKLYHTTYFNHAKQWATRAKTADELAGIHYGAQLPEDLAANMAKVISSVSGQ